MAFISLSSIGPNRSSWKANMQPEEVEQMLYEHAIRTKIRAPRAERLSNLGYNRVVTSGVIAGAALMCSLVVSKTAATSATAVFGGQPHLNNDSSNNRTNYHTQAADSSSSLAMSPMGG